MTECWATRYAHKPADKTIKGNCVGLARQVLREQFGREFPNLLGILKAAMKGEPPPMVETRRLRDGTLVVCGNEVNPVRHVGVYCRAADRVVHAVTDQDPGVVKCEPLHRLRIEWPTITFYNVMNQ